jgi:hypothetical protein
MASRCLCEPGGGGDFAGERCEAITASRGGGCGLLSRDGLKRDTPRFAGLEWTTLCPEVDAEYVFFAENGDEPLERADGEKVFVGDARDRSPVPAAPSLRAEDGRPRAVEPNAFGGAECHGLGAVRERGLLAFARASALARAAAATAARRASSFFSSVAETTDFVSPRM